MECGMGQDRRQDGILDGTVCGAMWEGRGGEGSGDGWSTRGRLIGWDGGRGVSCHGTGIGMGDGMGVGLGRKVKWE